MQSQGVDVENDDDVAEEEDELNDRNSVPSIRVAEKEEEEDQKPAILMQEQQTTDESTINNVVTEDEAQQAYDAARELTLSEHRKELIYENFEPRPGLPRLAHGSSSANAKAVLPAHVIKKRDARQKYGKKSPRRPSPIPAVYNKPRPAKQVGPSPQAVRERNTLRKLTRSFDHANLA